MGSLRAKFRPHHLRNVQIITFIYALTEQMFTKLKLLRQLFVKIFSAAFCENQKRIDMYGHNVNIRRFFFVIRKERLTTGRYMDT